MLDIKQIESFYPENLRHFKRYLLREYLQYKILEIIYDSEYAERLYFMGGTAIHIIHQNSRFSEDLDFDNLGLKINDFEKLTELIQKKINLEGYKTEIKNVFKKAYRSYIRFADILFDNGLSNHREEKLLIQLDTEPQGYKYSPEKVILNKFDIFMRINTVPASILLAQKIFSIFNRKRPPGRDFYDTAFLLSKTMPDNDYLKLKLNLKEKFVIKDALLQRCKNLDFKQLAKDVEIFLYNPEDSKKVLYFLDYLKSLTL